MESCIWMVYTERVTLEFYLTCSLVPRLLAAKVGLGTRLSDMGMRLSDMGMRLSDMGTRLPDMGSPS